MHHKLSLDSAIGAAGTEGRKKKAQIYSARSVIGKRHIARDTLLVNRIYKFKRLFNTAV